MSLLPDSADPIRLDGKVALVTGASRGIGRAIATALAARGATVAVHYNAAAGEADALVARLRAEGVRAFAVQADLSSPDGANALVERFVGALAAHDLPPQFDILVNNAGVGLRSRIDAVTPADFDRVLQVNLKSPFFLIQHALRHLRDGGRIVNISSMGTRAAYPEMSVYAPAKAGLEALTLLLAADLGVRGITVNAVLPGATATDLNKRASDPVAREAIAQTVALGRVGEPRDIADIVAFLASDAGRWITGQSLDASGGQRL
ncbi:SDR family oxidoreductase [Pandoraea apista]|uniref:SDR family oxidoreductase n=1 Tax=Pandoraea apista TaxID=93218 RepID=UPI0005A8F74F|nr:SDR family oxidoreductase [Pandoraea apista]AJF00973.2 short-chain dehydrogenase [Pandoraea apista]AKH72811.1 short-chain dehydrogenase [Pandoraea apista]AKI61197.1 short-chain dehydrogenase [Pandoraea apista]